MDNGKWWLNNKGTCHSKITAIVKHLDNNQSYRRVDNLRHARLYGNLDILGLSNATYARPNPTTVNHRVTLNVVQMCTDTLTAKIAKNKPMATFLTSGGDPALQKKAKDLEKFIQGQMYISKAHEKKTMSFRDACVFGTGFLKIYPDYEQNKICVERIMSDEIKVDDSDAVYGYPQCLYQIKAVNRDTLLAMYGKKAQAQIAALESVNKVQGFYSTEAADMVHICEAWHLPSYDGSGDGRHVICIEGADLFDEEWKRSSFPFAKMVINPKLFGFWGQGVAEQLVGIQIEINKLLRNMQVAHHLLSAPGVFVENGSKVLNTHLNNEIGRIVKYTGTKPTVEVFQTIHPEIYQHLERLYQRAFEVVGLSQLSATSQKPLGLDSGKALREYNNIETERFAVVGQSWEAFHLAIAEQLVLCAKDLYSQDKSLSVMTRDRKFLRQIKWKDVDMQEDMYQMHIFPTSSLPNEPAGRLAYVQEMAQAGFIGPEDAMELLDFPDLEQFQSLHVAARSNVRNTIAKILEEGVYEAPEPFMDLGYAVKYAQTIYNKAKIENVSEETLELLRRFAEQANLMLESAQPPPPPQPNQPPQAA